jgi:hypothetical protein
LTRIRSVWCSGLTLLLKHHSFPQKKIPKVCHIVGGVYTLQVAFHDSSCRNRKAP